MKVVFIICNLCSCTLLLLSGRLQYTILLANLIMSYAVGGASTRLLQIAQKYPDVTENQFSFAGKEKNRKHSWNHFFKYHLVFFCIFLMFNFETLPYDLLLWSLKLTAKYLLARQDRDHLLSCSMPYYSQHIVPHFCGTILPHRLNISAKYKQFTIAWCTRLSSST